jgi:hypothetical protein
MPVLLVVKSAPSQLLLSAFPSNVCMFVNARVLVMVSFSSKTVVFLDADDSVLGIYLENLQYLTKAARSRETNALR